MSDCDRCGERLTAYPYWPSSVEVLDHKGCWERITVCHRCKSNIDGGELSTVISVLLMIVLIAYGMSTADQGKHTLDKVDTAYTKEAKIIKEQKNEYARR